MLDVGSQTSRGDVRLVETARKSGCYAALSYCWGGTQQGVLHQNNLREYLSRINLAGLSLTIQQAVHLARDIGFRYLWVDAICIIQDDEDDKATEIHKMARIYRDAQVTIVVASGQSAQDGFLEHRHSKQPEAFLPIKTDSRSFGIACAMKLYHLDYSEPLDRQAWSLQEWILSPRPLVFTPQTLQWYDLFLCRLDLNTW